MDYIMVSSSTIGHDEKDKEGEHNINGIITNHAYSVIGAYDFQEVRLAKVRNPWGRI